MKHRNARGHIVGAKSADLTLGIQVTIDTDQLRSAIEEGKASNPTVKGVAGGYEVHVRIGDQSMKLMTKDGRSRIFTTSDNAVKYLRRLGADQLLIDFRGFV